MNSSAKITVVTLFAAATLGVAVISACTVTSSTDNNTDGGVSSTSSSSGSTTSSSGSTTSSSGSSGSTTSSSGTSGTPVSCATSKQDAGVKFRDDACQNCLNRVCCTQLTACFAIPESATNIDCNDYHQCIEAANGNAAEEATCDTVAGTSGIIDAYQAIADCEHGPDAEDAGATNCRAECEGQ